MTAEMIPRVAEEKLAEFCGVFCDIDTYSLEETRHILEVGRQYGLESRMYADAFSLYKAAEFAAEMQVAAASHLLMISDRGIEKFSRK